VGFSEIVIIFIYWVNGKEITVVESGEKKVIKKFASRRDAMSVEDDIN
jgi:hypothetical protein